MACKTIFICFLEDERRNDGSKSRPYAMSVELYKLLTSVQRPKRKRPVPKKSRKLCSQQRIRQRNQSLVHSLTLLES